MRGAVLVLLVLTLIMAPITSLIATALGFSGEHVHYDHTWHSAVDWARDKAAKHSHHHHAEDHDSDHHVDHDLAQNAHDDSDADADHHTDDGNAPLKHSHPDQVHAAPFVTVSVPNLEMPDLIVTVAPPPASFPVQQHPYPPFRPPQSAVSA